MKLRKGQFVVVDGQMGARVVEVKRTKAKVDFGVGFPRRWVEKSQLSGEWPDGGDV